MQGQSIQHERIESFTLSAECNQSALAAAPSFWQPLPNSVGQTADNTLGMTRTELHCRRCDSHFGHVFDDGPKPTGLRTA